MELNENNIPEEFSIKISGFNIDGNILEKELYIKLEEENIIFNIKNENPLFIYETKYDLEKLYHINYFKNYNSIEEVYQKLYRLLIINRKDSNFEIKKGFVNFVILDENEIIFTINEIEKPQKLINEWICNNIIEIKKNENIENNLKKENENLKNEIKNIKENMNNEIKNIKENMNNEIKYIKDKLNELENNFQFCFKSIYFDYLSSIPDNNNNKIKHNIKYSDGGIYSGQVNDNNIQHGNGIIIYNNRIYKGSFNKGKRERKGKIIFNNGKIYEGEWQNNKREGYGIYTQSDGYKYEGFWKNNKCEGKGIQIYNDGDIYYGEFKNNKREGKGIYINYEDEYKGDIKTRDCKDDLRNENSLFIKEDGYKYYGEWKNDKKEGKGKEYYLNGDIYEGDFKNNKKEGYGILFFGRLNENNGDIFKGNFKDDEIDGEVDYYIKKENKWKRYLYNKGNFVGFK